MRRIIILWMLVFMILVLLHEFWHFQAARKCWMKVPEFWIWLPPRICTLRKDKKWTEYTLNWIPLWWFCSIEWDDPTDKNSYKNLNTLFTAPIWKRLIVIYAWVAMNFLTAFVILTWLFRYWMDPISVSETVADKGSTSYIMASPEFLRQEWFLTWETYPWVYITSINEKSPAEELWLEIWDLITKIDDNDVFVANIQNLLTNDGTHKIEVERTVDWIQSIIPFQFECKEQCVLWVIIWSNWNLTLGKVKFWFLWAMKASLHEIKAERDLTINILWDFWKSLISFNKSEMKESINSFSWPVWAIKMWELLFEMWWRTYFFAFAAMISLALAYFNILPIPALDWGRAIWMLLQRAFKLKPEKYFKYEWYVNTVFFYLIMLLWIAIIFKDLHMFWWVNIPFIS